MYMCIVSLSAAMLLQKTILFLLFALTHNNLLYHFANIREARLRKRAVIVAASKRQL